MEWPATQPLSLITFVRRDRSAEIDLPGIRRESCKAPPQLTKVCHQKVRWSQCHTCGREQRMLPPKSKGCLPPVQTVRSPHSEIEGPLIGRESSSLYSCI